MIHVRGAARVNASASSLDGTLVVTGTVVDDTGRPVSGAALELHALSADGAAIELAAPERCPNASSAPAASPPAKPRTKQTLASDTLGRFCAAFSGEADRASVLVLGFDDPRGLLDAARARVTIDRARRGVELRIAANTATLELERETQRLQVSARVVGAIPAGSSPLPLAVYVVTPSGETLGAQGACPLDGSTELEVPSSKLPGPGPLELALRFAGTPSLQPAEARRRLLATARVHLELGQKPAPADPQDGIPLDVALGSTAGAVDGGSVEARLFGRTVGIAPVERGAAHLVARFPRQGDAANLELAYLPLEPWWRPGAALPVEVKLVTRTRWLSLGWLAALGALAAWLLSSWRRPERAMRGTASTPRRAAAAGVHLIRREDGQIGWRGVVRDAHDGAPIAGATVAVGSMPPEQRLIARVVTDDRGRFELPSDALGELELSVTAPWHSHFTCQAPPHGELGIELVSRRRSVLGRLVRWAERRDFDRESRAEPTPADVRQHGRRVLRPDVIEWAGAVERAAFGPEPVDETLERQITRREPPEQSDPIQAASKRDH